MSTPALVCRFRGSDQLVRNGFGTNGKQRFKCRACGRQSREAPAPNGHTPERRAEILRVDQERSSLRGLERTFGVSRNTITSWLKKGPINSRH